MKKSFEEQLKTLSGIALKEWNRFKNAVDEVTKLIQTKYPELNAEFEVSDGGIIFIDDSDGWEGYSIEDVYKRFGRR